MATQPLVLKDESGKSYKFPAGTSPQEALEFLNTQQGPKVLSPPPPGTPPGQWPPDVSLGGLAKGAWEGVKGVAGTPVALGKALAAPPTSPEESSIGPTGRLIKRVMFDPAAEMKEKAQHAKSPAESIGYSIAEAIPFVGPVAAKIGEKIGSGKVSEGIGEGLTYAAAPKIIEKAAKLPSKYATPPEVKIDNAYRAITDVLGPKKSDYQFEDRLREAAPEIAEESRISGKPIKSVQDVVDRVADAKKRVWAQYDRYLGPQKQYGQIDGNAVADAINKSLSAKMKAEGTNTASVSTIADKYRRPISLGEADQILHDTNNELDSFYKLDESGQNIADNRMAHARNLATADALRSAIDNKVETLVGPGAPQIRKTYGALTAVEKLARPKAIEVLREHPRSFMEQLNAPSTARDLIGGAGIGYVSGHPAEGVAIGTAAAGGEAALRAYNQWRAHPDNAIARAFKELAGQKSTLPTPPPPRVPRALLPERAGSPYEQGPGGTVGYRQRTETPAVHRGRDVVSETKDFWIMIDPETGGLIHVRKPKGAQP